MTLGPRRPRVAHPKGCRSRRASSRSGPGRGSRGDRRSWRASSRSTRRSWRRGRWGRRSRAGRRAGDRWRTDTRTRGRWRACAYWRRSSSVRRAPSNSIRGRWAPYCIAQAPLPSQHLRMGTNPPAGVGWALVLKRAPVWASVSLAVALSLAAADASAKPGTFAGSIGIKVPKGAEAGIRAVNRATGTVAAARPVGRSGRFSLSLAPGQYLVVGTVMTERGRCSRSGSGSASSRARSASAARSRPASASAGAASPRAAFVQELGNVTPGRLAVELPKVTGSTGDPDWDALAAGSRTS